MPSPSTPGASARGSSTPGPSTPGQVLTLTESAANRVRAMMAQRGAPAGGVRIGVRTAGCSGLAYTLEFAEAAGESDDVVEDKGATVFVDPEATQFLAGTEMDFVEGDLESGFVFHNPNEKSRCGCGESFLV